MHAEESAHEPDKTKATASRGLLGGFSLRIMHTEEFVHQPDKTKATSSLVVCFGASSHGLRM
jgi:hypothetical protein